MSANSDVSSKVKGNIALIKAIGYMNRIFCGDISLKATNITDKEMPKEKKDQGV